MFEKKLFEKICEAKCSIKELEDFVHNIDEKDFDLDCPFEIYYDLDRIIAVVEKYQNSLISDRYLAYWMNAYNWIIMGGFKIDYDNNQINLKEFLMWLICDWLDSLSFFSCSCEFELEKYKASFRSLNRVYLDCAECNAMYAPYGDNYDVVVFVVNEKSSYFVVLYDELDYLNSKCDIRLSDIDSIKDEIKRVNKIGYTRLAYGIFDYKDFE